MRRLVVVAAGVVLLSCQVNAALAMSTNAKVGECIRRCYVSLPHNPDMCIVDCIMTDGTHNPRPNETQPLVVKPELFGDIQVGPRADSLHTATTLKQSLDQGFTRRLR